MFSGGRAAVLQPASPLHHGGRHRQRDQRDRPPARHEIQSPGLNISCLSLVSEMFNYALGTRLLFHHKNTRFTN